MSKHLLTGHNPTFLVEPRPVMDPTALSAFADGADLTPAEDSSVFKKIRDALRKLFAPGGSDECVCDCAAKYREAEDRAESMGLALNTWSCQTDPTMPGCCRITSVYGAVLVE